MNPSTAFSGACRLTCHAASAALAGFQRVESSPVFIEVEIRAWYIVLSPSLHRVLPIAEQREPVHA